MTALARLNSVRSKMPVLIESYREARQTTKSDGLSYLGLVRQVCAYAQGSRIRTVLIGRFREWPGMPGLRRVTRQEPHIEEKRIIARMNTMKRIKRESYLCSSVFIVLEVCFSRRRAA